jgi:2-dehydropantoate 2-reductase
LNIVMIGRGVIASIYGRIFTDSGHAVRHLVRPGCAVVSGRAVEVDMLDGRAEKGGTVGPVPYIPECVEGFDDLGSVDLVFACVRHNQIADLAVQLRAAPLPRGGIVFFNNCWDDPAALSAGLPAVKVVWAFPMAGGVFSDGGRLECALQPVVHMESAGGVNQGLGRRVAELFASVGIAMVRHADMRAWLWRHFALNSGFLALTLSRGIGMAEVMDSRADQEFGLRLVREATKVAEARGIGRWSESGESSLARLPIWLARGILASVYRSNPIARRMMSMHGDVTDLAAAPRRVLAQARRLKIACPELEAAIAKIDARIPG